MYAAVEELRQWAGFLSDVCGSKPTREDTPPPSRAIVGRYPSGALSDGSIDDETMQTSLTQTTQESKSKDCGVSGLRK